MVSSLKNVFVYKVNGQVLYLNFVFSIKLDKNFNK